MPANTTRVTETNPKTGTLQNQEARNQGIPFHIPAAAVITTADNFRIVTLQESTQGVRYAVLGPVAVTHPTAGALTIVGWGVLDEASQTGISQGLVITPNTYKDGDMVVVRRMIATQFAIKYDPANQPAVGVGSARVDLQGRLSSVAADATHIQLSGAVRISVPGSQMEGQRPVGTMYYEFKDVVTP